MTTAIKQMQAKSNLDPRVWDDIGSENEREEAISDEATRQITNYLASRQLIDGSRGPDLGPESYLNKRLMAQRAQLGR